MGEIQLILTKHQKMKHFHIILSLGLIVAVLVASFAPPIQVAYAADLLNKSDTLTSLKISVVSNHTIVFRTPTGAADSTDTIIIDFGVTDTTWSTTGIVFGDVDLAHSAGGQSDCAAPTFSNEEVLAATPTATDWGFAINTSTDVITFTAPTDGIGVAAIATNACVQVQIGTNASGGTNQITNATTAQSYTINTAGAFGDSGDIVVTLLTDDQVAATATVDESLSFTISDNAIGFGTLTSSNARFATGDALGSATDPASGAHNLIVGTNATNGYTLTVDGSTLTSGGDTVDAMATEATSSAGTEQYGIRITVTGGIGAVDTVYDDTPTDSFALVTGDFPDTIGTAGGASADSTFEVHYLGNIASNTEAGSYTSTLTYTATATF